MQCVATCSYLPDFCNYVAQRSNHRHLGSNLFMGGCKKPKLTMGQYSILCQIEIALYWRILWLYGDRNINKILTFETSLWWCIQQRDTFSPDGSNEDCKVPHICLFFSREEVVPTFYVTQGKKVNILMRKKIAKILECKTKTTSAWCSLFENQQQDVSLLFKIIVYSPIQKEDDVCWVMLGEWGWWPVFMAAVQKSACALMKWCW